MSVLANALYEAAMLQVVRIPLVIHVAAASQAIPVLAAVRHRLALPTVRRWIVAWCVVLLATDALQLLVRGQSTSNVGLRAVGSAVQNGMMLWALSLWQRNPVDRLMFRLAIPICLLAVLALTPTLRENGVFDLVSEPLQLLLLLAGALYTLVKSAAREVSRVPITHHDWFWITLGLSLYYGVRVVLRPFAAFLMTTDVELVKAAFLVQAWIDIVAYLLIARGIWCRLPQPHSGGYF